MLSNGHQEVWESLCPLINSKNLIGKACDSVILEGCETVAGCTTHQQTCFISCCKPFTIFIIFAFMGGMLVYLSKQITT